MKKPLLGFHEFEVSRFPHFRSPKPNSAYSVQDLVMPNMAITMRAYIEAGLKCEIIRVLVDKIETAGLEFTGYHTVSIRQTWTPAWEKGPGWQYCRYTAIVDPQPSPRFVTKYIYTPKEVAPKFQRPLARLFFWIANKLEAKK